MKVLDAKVVSILEATAQGLVKTSGSAAQAVSAEPGPFFVRLEFDDPALAADLPAGSVGQAAIYTTEVKPAHLIRKVMIRMTAWMNYLMPL